MNDLNARALLEHFEGPGFIRPISLPVEDTNLCCTNHGTPKDQNNQPLKGDQFQKNTKIHGFFSQELIEKSVSEPYGQLIFREYPQLLGGSIEINWKINLWDFSKQIGRSFSD